MVETKNEVVRNALKSCNAFKPGDVVKYKTNYGPATGYFVRKDAMGYVVSDEKDGGKEHTIPEHWIMNSVAANAEGDGLLNVLRKAKESIGSALGNFNSRKHPDDKWARKVSRACDDVARAINNAQSIIVG